MQRPAPEFLAMVRTWMHNPARTFLSLIWWAYDDMLESAPPVDARDLERSITQLLEPRVRDAMTGDEPFYVQHTPYERETMKPPPAQPPEYDLAFVFRADERVMWPMEAKILETPNAVANYVNDIRQEFLSCRYAPFSDSCAMLGYLLSGSSNAVFASVSRKLPCTMHSVPEHPSRPNRVSHHLRTVPPSKPYPKAFDCFHLVLEFPDLSRQS